MPDVSVDTLGLALLLPGGRRIADVAVCCTAQPLSSEPHWAGDGIPSVQWCQSPGYQHNRLANNVSLLCAGKPTASRPSGAAWATAASGTPDLPTQQHDRIMSGAGCSEANLTVTSRCDQDIGQCLAA